MKRKVAMFILLGVVLVKIALVATSEQCGGFVVGKKIGSISGQLEYIEAYGGVRRKISYVGVIDDSIPGGMYFKGRYNALLGKTIWIETWGRGLTKELVYVEKIYSVGSITHDTKYLGLKGFSGLVPGVDVENECDAGGYISADNVVWLVGTEDYVFSEEHQAAINNAKRYAEAYNQKVRDVRCEVSK